MKIEKEHRKSTLMSWEKQQLVELIMCLEHNNNVLHDTIDQQAMNFEKLLGEETNDWIPCNERLPEPEIPVLFTNKNGQVGIGRLSENGNWCMSDSDGWFIVSAIAWMPLPEPYQPKEENADWKEHIINRFMKQD